MNNIQKLWSSQGNAGSSESPNKHTHPLILSGSHKDKQTSYFELKLKKKVQISASIYFKYVPSFGIIWLR